MKQQLDGQTLVVIGGSSGIGLASARHARAEGAAVIVTGRDPQRLRAAGEQVGALSTAAFDATNPEDLDSFFGSLSGPVDHVMVAAGGAYYAPLSTFRFREAHDSVDEHIWLPLRVARHSLEAVRPGGSLVLISGTGSRRAGVGLALGTMLAAALPALTATLALELAPTRVNLLAPGFVDTSLSAAILGDQLEARRAELARTLPIRRVVGPDDVATLAVHLMTNTALTAATFDIDGGQQAAAAS
ncbi:MAG: SDR family oxidoreductase [Nocardioides sp.]